MPIITQSDIRLHHSVYPSRNNAWYARLNQRSSINVNFDKYRYANILLRNLGINSGSINDLITPVRVVDNDALLLMKILAGANFLQKMNIFNTSLTTFDFITVEDDIDTEAKIKTFAYRPLLKIKLSLFNEIKNNNDNFWNIINQKITSTEGRYCTDFNFTRLDNPPRRRRNRSNRPQTITEEYKYRISENDGLFASVDHLMKQLDSNKQSQIYQLILSELHTKDE